MKYYRHKPKPQRNHTDDWLMTYADMITLLLCSSKVSARRII